MLSNRFRRDDLLRVKGFPEGDCKVGVSLSGLPKGPQGDVDILLCEPSPTFQTTAIQAKRVKVGAQAFETHHPNRLAEFDKLCDQSNLLIKLGFSQVYAYVFVMVDSRQNNKGENTYDGLTNQLKEIVSNSIQISKLHPAVGVIQFEHVQPMDYPPFEVGSFGGNLIRLATPMPQSESVTTWVEKIMSSSRYSL